MDFSTFYCPMTKKKIQSLAPPVNGVFDYFSNFFQLSLTPTFMWVNGDGGTTFNRFSGFHWEESCRAPRPHFMA
jgi:hypothetical protein